MNLTTILLALALLLPSDQGHCLDAWIAPNPGEILPFGKEVDIHVWSTQTNGFLLSDGVTFLWSPRQPLRGVKLYPNREYKVSIGGPVAFPNGEMQGCILGPFEEAEVHTLHLVSVAKGE